MRLEGRLKPQGRREWVRLVFDICLLLFFFYFIYFNSFSYNEGFKAGVLYGKTACMNQFLHINITNQSGLWIPP
jgi:drug/metabolite transporter (DMT)-like permease